MKSTAMLENRLWFLYALCHTRPNMKYAIPRINETKILLNRKYICLKLPNSAPMEKIGSGKVT